MGCLRSECLSAALGGGPRAKSLSPPTYFASVKPGVGLGTSSSPRSDRPGPRSPPPKAPARSTTPHPFRSSKANRPPGPAPVTQLPDTELLTAHWLHSFCAKRNQLPTKQPSILKYSPGHSQLLKIMGVSSERLLL